MVFRNNESRRTPGRLVVDFSDEAGSIAKATPAETQIEKRRQVFSGSTHEVKTQVAGTTDSLVVTMLEARLGSDDRVIVDGKQPANPAMGVQMGGEVPIATVGFGSDPATQPQFWLFSLTPQSDPDVLRSFGGLADAEHALGLVLMEPRAGRAELYPQKTTLLESSTSYGVLGKRTNLQWSDSYGHELTSSQLSQVLPENLLYVTVVDGDVAFTAISGALEAVVTTRTTQEHLAVLAQQQ